MINKLIEFLKYFWDSILYTNIIISETSLSPLNKSKFPTAKQLTKDAYLIQYNTQESIEKSKIESVGTKTTHITTLDLNPIKSGNSIKESTLNIAKQKALLLGFDPTICSTTTELIWRVQKEEGFSQCYKKKSECTEKTCCWRAECFSEELN